MASPVDLAPQWRRTARRIALFVGVVLAVALASLAGLVASLDVPAIEARLLEGIRKETGATIHVSGTQSRAWPTPRIVFDGLDLTHSGLGIKISVNRAVIRLGLFDLIDGNADRPNIDLQNALIEAPLDPFYASIDAPQALTGSLQQVIGAFDASRVLTQLRLTVRQGRLSLVHHKDPALNLVIDPFQAALRYSASEGRIDLFAKRASDIRPFEITASLPTAKSVTAGQSAPVSVLASGFGSRFSLRGSMMRERDISVKGTITASIDGALERLFGLQRHGSRKGNEEPTTIESDIMLDNRGIGFQALKISRDTQMMTGVAALREHAGRWNIAATLAGDLIDGSATHAAMSRLREGDGRWTRDTLSLNPAPNLDLDLRISTKQFKLGSVVLDNVALAMFTRGERLEFSIADAKFGDGNLKGRVSLTHRGSTQDVRLFFSGDRVDASVFFEKAFGLNRIKGTGQFVAQLDGKGESVEQLVSSLHGSARIDIRNGALDGIDLQRLMARMSDTRPEAAVFMALGGRTTFSLFSTDLSVRQGRIEPIGSQFMAGKVAGTVEGAIDLPGLRHELAVTLRKVPEQDGSNGDFFGFRVDGPLFGPVLRMDQSLLNRKG